MIRVFGGIGILGLLLGASVTGSASSSAYPIHLVQANSTGDAAVDTQDDNTDMNADPTQDAEKTQPPDSANKTATPAVTLQEFLADTRSVESLNLKELREKLRAGRALVKGGTLSRPDKKRVASVLRVTRAQIKKLRPNAGKKGEKPKAGQGQSNETTAPKANP